MKKNNLCNKKIQKIELKEKKSSRKFNAGAKACAENVEKCKERSDLKRNKGKHALKAKCQPAKLPTCKMARPEEFSAPKK